MCDDWGRRQRRLLRLWRASAAVLVAACLLTGYLSSSVATTPHPHLMPTAAAPLVGSLWQLIGYRSAQGVPASFDTAEPLTAQFARDGTMAGSIACHHYGGPYAIHGPAITIRTSGLDQSACGWSGGAQRPAYSLEPPAWLEFLYLGDLQRVQTYRISGTRLSLLAATGTPLLVFIASTQPAPATATTSSHPQCAGGCRQPVCSRVATAL
jgi:heat shock protein HslJ